MNPTILTTLAGIFLNKKRIIGWVSSVAFVAAAAAAGMQQEDFKAAVCGAPVVKVEAAE